MKKIILLIDDDVDEFDFYNEALQEINFPGNLIHVNNAAQALVLLGHVTPDYIFLDYNMPKMNGLTFLEKIKKMIRLQHVPVILSSTQIDDKLTKDAIALGASFCIRKACKVQSLAEILQHVFSMYTRFHVSNSAMRPN
jgi:CheY-like chemotaxis protein